MALVNYATREINAKVVYYGPGLSGKTTNIQSVYEKVRPDNKGKLISLSTQGDRTLFFDFLPVELGKIKGFRTRFHLYTVPGQVFYNSTRKLVLKGADGVVFVADSQKMMMSENVQSFENLKQNLTDMGVDVADFPIVIQYNKRDLPEAATVEEMEDYLNPKGLPYFEASAVKGEGVLPTLTALVKFILHDLKHDPEGHQINLDDISGETSDESQKEPEADVIKVQAAVPAPEISIPDQEPELETGPEPEPEPEPELPPIPAPVLEKFDEDEEYAELPPNEEEPEETAFPAFDIEEQETAPVPELIEEISAGDVEENVASPESVQEDVQFAGPVEDSIAPADEFSPVDEIEAIIDPVPEAEELLSYEPRGKTLGGSRLAFSLPVRLTTQGGIKEVMMKVSLDVELSGEGADSVSAIEILPPMPRLVDQPKPVERPKEPPSLPQKIPGVGNHNPLPQPTPEGPSEKPPDKPADKAASRVLKPRTKTSMFQKFFGR